MSQATTDEMLETETSTMLPNYTIPTATTPYFNPWAGQFGTLQIFEIIFLTILTVIGTIGNLVVVFSIALERRVHAHGNVFIINLALADLIITGFIVPSVIANVVKTDNALSTDLCKAVGYLVTVTCSCSLCNLMFIALNRYWAVVKPNTYVKTFSRKRVVYMMIFTWVWSCLLVSPTVLGWGGLKYDAKIMICSWDDEETRSFTIFITICAIFIPLCIIAFCYFKLFTTVRSSGRWVRSLSVSSGVSQNNDQHRRSMRKEQSLLRTLATTVVVFCVCWLPFGFCVMIDPINIDSHAKKIFGWVALSNSCVNFIIYGAMNPVFRRGYHNLFIFIFRCKRSKKISSTMIHGSFSDSFKPNRRITRSSENGKPKPFYRSRSDLCKENSRIDTINGAHTQITLATNSPALIHHPPKASASDPGTGIISISQRNGIMESLRRASLIVKSRPRLHTAGEKMTQEEKLSRLKRNSAMLLQIQVGDDEFDSDDDDEMALNMEARHSRRAMSDIPVSARTAAKGNTVENTHLNGNGNLNLYWCDNMGGSPEKESNLENTVMKAPLRGTWMPEDTVYRSRDQTPVLGRSPRKKSTPVRKGSADTSPTKNEILTISKIVDEPIITNAREEDNLPGNRALEDKDCVTLPGEIVSSKSATSMQGNSRPTSPTVTIASGPVPASPGEENYLLFKYAKKETVEVDSELSGMMNNETGES